MALKNVLPLNPVVNVIVNLSTISAPRKAFNLALLMGTVPGAVTDFSGDTRIVKYDSLNAMLEAGFQTTDRLYQAASLIFGQAKTPPMVAIGKVADGEVLRSESEILGTAEQGISCFGGIADADAVVCDLASVNVSAHLIPQPSVCGEEIDRCHERVVLFVHLPDCLGKGFFVLIVFELHGVFLAFSDVVAES